MSNDFNSSELVQRGLEWAAGTAYTQGNSAIQGAEQQANQWAAWLNRVFGIETPDWLNAIFEWISNLFRSLMAGIGLIDSNVITAEETLLARVESSDVFQAVEQASGLSGVAETYRGYAGNTVQNFLQSGIPQLRDGTYAETAVQYAVAFHQAIITDLLGDGTNLGKLALAHTDWSEQEVTDQAERIASSLSGLPARIGGASFSMVQLVTEPPQAGLVHMLVQAQFAANRAERGELAATAIPGITLNPQTTGEAPAASATPPADALAVGRAAAEAGVGVGGEDAEPVVPPQVGAIAPQAQVGAAPNQ